MVGVAIMLVLFIVMAIRMTRAQLSYFRLYRQLRDPDFRMVHERTDLLGRPGELFSYGFGSTRRQWDLIFQRQPEPDLERARQRVVRHLLALLVLTLLFPFVGMASSALL